MRRRKGRRLPEGKWVRAPSGGGRPERSAGKGGDWPEERKVRVPEWREAAGGEEGESPE